MYATKGKHIFLITHLYADGPKEACHVFIWMDFWNLLMYL